MENYLLHILNRLSYFAVGIPEYWTSWFMWKQRLAATIVSWCFLQNLSKAFLVYSLWYWANSFCLWGCKVLDLTSGLSLKTAPMSHIHLFPTFFSGSIQVYAVYSSAKNRTSPLEPPVLPVPPSSLSRPKLSSINILGASACSENRSCYCSRAFPLTLSSISHPAFVSSFALQLGPVLHYSPCTNCYFSSLAHNHTCWFIIHILLEMFSIHLFMTLLSTQRWLGIVVLISLPWERSFMHFPPLFQLFLKFLSLADYCKTDLVGQPVVIWEAPSIPSEKCRVLFAFILAHNLWLIVFNCTDVKEGINMQFCLLACSELG